MLDIDSLKQKNMFPTAIQQFDYSKSEQSILSIRITTDGFYFSIYNPLNASPYSLFKAELDAKIPFVANFKSLIANNPFLSQLYKQVNIVIANTKTVLHPLHLFDNKDVEATFYYGQKSITPTNDILYNTLPELNQAVLFGIHSTLHKFLTEHFSNPTILAQTTCLLKGFSMEAKRNTHKTLFIHFEGDVMQFYAYNKDRLLLNNVFKATELNNQVYYILNCWKQLNFSQEKDEVQFCGDLSLKEELFQIIKKYIVDVTIQENSEYIDLKSINL